jgi:hypothetical protein
VFLFPTLFFWPRGRDYIGEPLKQKTKKISRKMRGVGTKICPLCGPDQGYVNPSPQKNTNGCLKMKNNGALATVE